MITIIRDYGFSTVIAQPTGVSSIFEIWRTKKMCVCLGVHRDRNQFATDVHAEHADRVVPPSAGQRQLRFRKRTRNGE